MRQLFIIEGRLIAECHRLLSPQNFLSGLWFCKHCGDCYARAPILRPDGTQLPWQSYRACCRKCKSSESRTVPGSLWLTWDKPFLSALPDAVLRWELERHLDFYERDDKL